MSQDPNEAILPMLRGIGRLRWLTDEWVFPKDTTEAHVSRYVMVGDARTAIECNLALIEELHDFAALIRPLVVQIAGAEVRITEPPP